MSSSLVGPEKCMCQKDMNPRILLTHAYKSVCVSGGGGCDWYDRTGRGCSFNVSINAFFMFYQWMWIGGGSVK